MLHTTIKGALINTVTLVRWAQPTTYIQRVERRDLDHEEAFELPQRGV